MDQHLIIPPLELVDEWVAMLQHRSDVDVFTKAASWGYLQAVKKLEQQTK